MREASNVGQVFNLPGTHWQVENLPHGLLPRFGEMPQAVIVTAVFV
jgi:hypothetical protein